MFELVSIDLPGYFKSFAKTWSDVAKTIGNSDDYENQLDKTRSFDDELDTLLAQHPDQVSKMKAIFKYVKDNVTWNGMDGKYFFYGLKKTLKEKKGNAADMNLLVVAMLRYAGINSHPVVISTKDNTIPFFPTVERLNHVLAYAVIDEKPYFLDATEEFSDINVLPVKDYNWQGILINNHDMVWKQINIIAPPKSNRMCSVRVQLQEDGSCEGTFNSRLDKHSALKFRKTVKDIDMEEYLNFKIIVLGPQGTSFLPQPSEKLVLCRHISECHIGRSRDVPPRRRVHSTVFATTFGNVVIFRYRDGDLPMLLQSYYLKLINELTS